MAFECEAGKILIGLADRVVKDTNRFRYKDGAYFLHCPQSDRNTASLRSEEMERLIKFEITVGIEPAHHTKMERGSDGDTTHRSPSA
jgi:hypothetical protein